MPTLQKLIGPAVASAALLVPSMARAERCSDGTERRERDRDAPSMVDDDCVERNIWLMPGVFGTFFQPSADLGPFYGGGVQFAPFQWSHNNDRFGPSQGSVVVQAALLDSARTAGTLAIFELGATASLERNSSRRWLIPYFGATVGGITHTALGTSAYAHPLGGVHLFWHRNLMLDVDGGYHFPFKDIDQTRGPRAQLSARFSLW
ncbi:MAG: hypothetical protein KC657_32890 [Myxococcales bacterium]|nr:hypothetical protein [Myxococcales bacterium]